jgi:hypothetical protein
MKKWLVAAAALAFVATASPALVGQAQAQAGPPKNPFCALPGSDYTWARALEAWADRYDCWGYPIEYFHSHHEWSWGGPPEHRWWWHHHHHHWYWRHHHHHHQ